MAKLNKKRCTVIAGAWLIAAVLAVVILAADYAGTFGKFISCGSADTAFSFKCLDKETGSPVAGVQLGCFWEGKQTQRTSIRTGAEGSTNDGTIQGGVMHAGGRLETRYFILRDDAAEARKKSVEFVFSHPSYQKETRTYVLGRLRKDIVIELAPIKRMTGE